MIAFLSKLGSVRSVAAGTMCKTAIIDKALESVIDISRCDLPSRTLSLLACTVPVIVNNGKTLASGIAFGDIVMSRFKKTAVHVERSSEKDGAVILWEHEANALARQSARAMAKYFQLPIIFLKPEKGERETVCHSVRCACPGEPLFINGAFVGIVNGPEVKAYARDGIIIDIEGVHKKEAGLARLGSVRIGEARFKSGYIRKRGPEPYLCPVRDARGKMAIIDHSAFSSLEAVSDDTVCALTIGDDTTEVAGDVLARRGVRVIGITDGDKDGVLNDAMKACGSVVFKVSGITDDEAGARIAGKIVKTNTFEGFLNNVVDELERMNVSYEACP